MATPAVGGPKGAVAAAGLSNIAKTADVLGLVKSALTHEAGAFMKPGEKLSWTATLPGVFAEARAAFGTHPPKGGITREQLVDKAAQLVAGKLEAVNTKGAGAVSADEVKKLHHSSPEAAKLVGGAYAKLTGRTVELTAPAKTETAAPAAHPAKKDQVDTQAKADAAALKGDGAHAAENHQEVSKRAKTNGDGLGFGVSEGSALPGAVMKVLGKLGPQVSGTEMNKLLEALDKTGTSTEAVADQLIKGKGPIAELLVGKGAKHQLTMDALGAVVERLKSKGVPQDATPAQAKEVMGRIDGLGALLISGNLTGVDHGSDARGAKPAADVLKQAKAVVGKGGVLTQDAYQRTTGVMRQAADHLFAMGGAGAQISTQMLAMAASQIIGGASMVMGSPFPFMGGYGGFGGMGGMPEGGIGTWTPWSIPLNPLQAMSRTEATGAMATWASGFMPTGNVMFDLSSSIANAPTYSPTEQALLSKIKDPEQRAIQELQMQMQKQSLMATVLTNLANMRHEMLKAVAQNLRG